MLEPQTDIVELTELLCLGHLQEEMDVCQVLQIEERKAIQKFCVSSGLKPRVGSQGSPTVSSCIEAVSVGPY